MAPAATTSIWYVYGIVPASFPPGALPAGLDESTLMLERESGLAALASELDGAAYAPASIEASSGDVEWLSPRAVAHDRVLTWASDRGAVVPLPMFSLFSGGAAVRDMLRARAAELSAALERVAHGREYALRVYRVDTELLASVTSLSDRLRVLADRAAAAAPGQQYLLERKLDGEKRVEMRAVTHRVVAELLDGLAPVSAGVVRSPVPKVADGGDAGRGTMVLSAAFLVAPARLEEFQRTLTAFVGRYGPAGFRFDFTGPWPPYHFAAGSVDDETADGRSAHGGA
jgi:hypothetical protein